jgi:hypothetical protein
MKIINPNGWAPRDIKWVSYAWNAPVPITNPLIADNKLFYNFYFYGSRGGPAWFYYGLLYFDEDD